MTPLLHNSSAHFAAGQLLPAFDLYRPAPCALPRHALASDCHTTACILVSISWHNSDCEVGWSCTFRSAQRYIPVPPGAATLGGRAVVYLVWPVTTW